MNTTTLLILSPVVAATLLPVVTIGLAKATGLVKMGEEWLATHKQAAMAHAVDVAWTQVDSFLETSASVIAGQIQSGKLNWLDRAAWQRVAVSEVLLVQQRAPAAVLAVAAEAPTLLVQLMGKVDDKVVASPTIAAPAAGGQLPSAASVAAAVATVTAARAALNALDGPSAPANDPAPIAAEAATQADPTGPTSVPVATAAAPLLAAV